MEINTFTKKEAYAQEKNDRRQFSNNRKGFKRKKVNNYHNKEKWMKNYYPKELVYSFNFNLENIKRVNKIITNFSKGRHILDLSALDILSLQKHPRSRKNALYNILTSTVYEETDIDKMAYKYIVMLSDYVYEQIRIGIEAKIKELGLDFYLTPDRIINSGNVLKNHNGQAEYGGATIRDYITYYAKQEKAPELTDSENLLISEGIDAFQKILNANGYNTLKSIPFSVMRMESHFKLNENKEIISPDIEAKDNIRKIIKQELYEKYPFSKLSAKEATKIEVKLLKLIKPVIKQQIKTELTPLIPMLPNEQITEDIKQAIQLENVAVISKKGRIEDVIKYMKHNVEIIANLESDKNNHKKRLTEDEIHAIFQIEYAAMPSSEDADIFYWISELGQAMKCIYATYPMIKVLIKYKFVPIIDNMPVTRYTDNYKMVDELLSEAIETESPQEYFENKFLQSSKDSALRG